MTTDQKPPQYTAFGASPAAPQGQPPEEDELARRCRLWREKNPSRAAALRRVVAPVLGCKLDGPAGEKFAASFCEPLENRVLASVFGVEERGE